MSVIEQNYENEKMGTKAQLKPGINYRYPEQIHILFTILSSGVIRGHFCGICMLTFNAVSSCLDTDE